MRALLLLLLDAVYVGGGTYVPLISECGTISIALVIFPLRPRVAAPFFFLGAIAAPSVAPVNADLVRVPNSCFAAHVESTTVDSTKPADIPVKSTTVDL